MAVFTEMGKTGVGIEICFIRLEFIFYLTWIV